MLLPLTLQGWGPRVPLAPFSVASSCPTAIIQFSGPTSAQTKITSICPQRKGSSNPGSTSLWPWAKTQSQISAAEWCKGFLAALCSLASFLFGQSAPSSRRATLLAAFRARVLALHWPWVYMLLRPAPSGHVAFQSHTGVFPLPNGQPVAPLLQAPHNRLVLLPFLLKWQEPKALCHTH